MDLGDAHFGMGFIRLCLDFETPPGLKNADKHKVTLWCICSCYVYTMGSGICLFSILLLAGEGRHERRSPRIRLTSDQPLLLGAHSFHLFLWPESLAVTEGWKVHLPASAAKRTGRKQPSSRSMKPAGRTSASPFQGTSSTWQVNRTQSTAEANRSLFFSFQIPLNYRTVS